MRPREWVTHPKIEVAGTMFQLFKIDLSHVHSWIAPLVAALTPSISKVQSWWSPAILAIGRLSPGATVEDGTTKSSIQVLLEHLHKQLLQLLEVILAVLLHVNRAISQRAQKGSENSNGKKISLTLGFVWLIISNISPIKSPIPCRVINCEKIPRRTPLVTVSRL